MTLSLKVPDTLVLLVLKSKKRLMHVKDINRNFHRHIWSLCIDSLCNMTHTKLINKAVIQLRKQPKHQWFRSYCLYGSPAGPL